MIGRWNLESRRKNKMIYSPSEMRKTLLEAAIRHRVENYRGKGHNKVPHNKVNFSNKKNYKKRGK